MRALLFSIMCFFPTLTFACDAVVEECVTMGQWNVAVSVGVGVSGTPVSYQSNEPIWLVPDIYYYGERFFFDNGVVGYTVYDSPALSVSAISQVNYENWYFRGSSSGVYWLKTFASEQSDPTSTEVTNPKYVKSGKRKWALDAGLQVNWNAYRSVSVEARLMHDVTSVYNGMNAEVLVNYALPQSVTKNWMVNLGIGMQWKSTELVDYYYGVNNQLSLDPALQYIGKQGVSPFMRVDVSRKVSQHWSFRFYWRRIHLANSIYTSPIVDESNIDTVFMGWEYDF